MDSLGNYHDNTLIARPIRKWLNREWKERGKQSPKYVNGALFSRKSIPLINPVVLQQKSVVTVVYLCVDMHTTCM